MHTYAFGLHKLICIYVHINYLSQICHENIECLLHNTCHNNFIPVLQLCFHVPLHKWKTIQIIFVCICYVFIFS